MTEVRLVSTEQTPDRSRTSATDRRTGVESPAAPTPPRRRRSFGRWFADTGWRHVVAIVVSIFAIFPLLYVALGVAQPAGHPDGLEPAVLGDRHRQLRAAS